MSTASTNLEPHALRFSSVLTQDQSEPLYYGLTLLAWVKIAVVAVLMAALFRINLSRLWLKTNPFTGQPNWEHSMIIPIIGLYYLYVWRDKLLRPDSESAEAKRWTLFGLWGLAGAIAVATLILACMAYAPLALIRPKPFLGVSVPYIALFAVGWLVASAIFLILRRDSIHMVRLNQSLTALWRMLGTWTMANLVLWGIAFFLWVVHPLSFLIARYLLVVVSLVSLYAIILLRNSPAAQGYSDRLMASSAAWFGGFVMLWGILFFLWGIWPGQNDFFKDVGMVVALFGVVTLLAGWRVMKIAWFPIVFLFCALPWPGLIYSWIASPLQLLAAKVAVHVLQICGVEAAHVGTKINFTGADGIKNSLNVEEACSGLRSLMTFVSVAAAIAFLSARPLWQKLTITISAIPIAISCNVMRVSGQGLLHRYVSKSLSEGFAHGFVGLVMLIPGFFLILGVCWILDHLFIEEMDDQERLKLRKKSTVIVGATTGAINSSARVGTVKPVELSQQAKSQVTQIPRQTGIAPARPVAASPSASKPIATPVATTAARLPTAAKPDVASALRKASAAPPNQPATTSGTAAPAKPKSTGAAPTVPNGPSMPGTMAKPAAGRPSSAVPPSSAPTAPVRRVAPQAPPTPVRKPNDPTPREGK